MSGIAGIVERDGAPVDTDALRTLIEAQAHRGDAPARLWHGGSAGLAHCLRPRTPEAALERGPHTAIADARIVFDGRIDNREELLDALAPGGPAGDVTDADVVLAAYARWGEDCAVRLFGDFAFAIWDARERRLFCARDILGMRPFCYAERGSRFAFASEAHALIRAGVASTAVNEGMVGEYLSTTILHRSETLFRDIRRLEPAHVLVVSAAEGTRTARYWSPDPARTIRYRHDDDYAEHLRELLRDAVRVRLRSCGPVAVMLSGGLDSSAVLGAARSLDQPRRLEALTAAFPGLPCDETFFSRRMTEAAGVPARVTAADDPPAEWFRAQARAYLDVPDGPNSAMFEGLKRDASARGIGVLLFGCGGDEWFTGSVFHYGDWLRQGRLLQIAMQIPRDARAYGWRRSLFLATRVGMWPTMPRRLRLGVRRLLGRAHRTPPWIAPDFARRINLAERLRWELPGGFTSFAQADTFRTSTSGITQCGDEMEDRSASRAGVDERHPFYDRRLVEFALSIPEDQRCRGALEKYVLRQAVRPWVPAAIRERIGKAEFSDSFVTALRRFGGRRAFLSLRVAELGWVDGDRLAAMYDEMERHYAARHPRFCWLTDPLWLALSIELWLAAVSTPKLRAQGSGLRAVTGLRP